MTPSRPPYRMAAVAAAIVLGGYLLTLAPTVTFWDAGEFITAARTLGIPHEPGTPLFVLLAHVWGLLIPFGEYAWRINLFSAACSAVAAGCWFLVAHDAIARIQHDIDDRSRAALATLGGLAAALLASFTFTAWQNSNETEVYASAVLGIALVAWIATCWRQHRDTPMGARLLLTALYCCALAVGDDLMGLLVGPALVALLAVTAWREPLAARHRRDWSRIALVASAWLVLVGIGLGSVLIVGAGVAAVAASAVASKRNGDLRFAGAVALVTLVGASTVLFLLVRARQHPWLDQGNPSTWHALLDVIRRAQYPPRTPFDDPTVLHGPGNPGRTLTLLAYQVANYAQYFDWQWAAAFGDLARASWVRLGFTLLMATLGVRGAFAQRRRDPGSFALIGMLFLVAGPGLVLYLNFKPGASIGWDRWLNLADHEVRDRDYFFVASFVAWAIWVAIGLVDVAREVIPKVAPRRRTAAAAVFVLALVPLVFNWRAATRRQTPEVTLAHDFGTALLQSVPPNGVLFTWGDNDTFPLWYLQQVEGVRRDVTVICLPLTNTVWYDELLGRQRHVDAAPDELPALWRGAPLAPVAWSVHGLDDRRLESFRPFRLQRDEVLDLGRRGVARFAAGGVVTPLDLTVFAVLEMNAGHRPVAWSISAADALYGLGPHLVQQGMALVLPMTNVDSTALAGGDAAGPHGAPLDLVTTERLINEVWHFGRLEDEGDSRFDGGVQAVAGTIAAPYRQVGVALLARGDTAGGIAMLRRAVRMGDDSVAGVVLDRTGHGSRE